MTLTARVYCGYASYEGEHAWGDPEHVAHKFIQILKGEPANGYAWLPRPGQSTVKISTDLAAVAFDAWGRWAAAHTTTAHPEGGYLVPIPSASCTAPGADAKGQALVTAVAQHAPAFEAVDALYWHEEWLKARNGGPRDPDVLFTNIRYRTDLPKRPIILVDDVVTGGGHAIACARALRLAGHDVRHVLAAAQTVKSPPAAGLFQIPDRDLEAAPAVG